MATNKCFTESPLGSQMSAENPINGATLVNLLKSTVKGQLVLTFNDQNNNIDLKHQKTLVHCIVENYVGNRAKFTYAHMQQWSNAICEVFTKEKAETYFLKRKDRKKNPTGKLFSRWTNADKEIFDNCPSTAAESVTDLYSDKYFEQKCWLQHNCSPWDHVISVWRETRIIRIQEIRSATSLSHILLEWPRYNDFLGHELVVISGALCTVEDYVIMSQCAHNKAIYLAAEGTVSVTDISQTQNITIVGRPDFVNNNFKIALYAKETQRYLCFNDHWKLVGMKELQDTCYFNEAIVHGYFVFRSVVDLQRRIGFTQRGRAVGPKKTVNDACYMFTKIPTDQFFHQHQHFSSLSSSLASRSRSSTTKAPRTSEHSGGGAHLGGRGSGGGRPKQNRPRNQHRSEEVEQHSSHKKPKGHGNSRKRQHQQRLQQMRGGHSGSHSLSDPKNSTYLNSSRQNNVVLSQYGGHNHTGKHHNHSQPQYHQTRHHHSDARRHHHESKQKTRAHHRARVTPSPEAAMSTTAATTMSTWQTSEQTAAVSSTKPKLASSSEYADIRPTSVVQPLSTLVAATVTTTTNHDVLATSVSHKRKGRRRKPHRKHTFHKSETPHESSGSHSGETTSRGKHNHAGHATLPSYDDEEYMTTDYTTWISNNDMSAMGLPASVKPTSASLPTWETWYPSASTPMMVVEETSSDFSSTAVASYEKDDTPLSSSSSSSLPSHYDISKTPLPLMPLPFPTSAFFSSTSQLHTHNNIDDDIVISPTTVTMTDLGPKTINTSTFSETESWSSSRQHDDDDFVTAKEAETFLVTPKLAEGSGGDFSNVTEHSHMVAEELENATNTTTTASDELTDDSESAEVAATTEVTATAGELLLSAGAALNVTPTKRTESHALSTKTQDASTVSGSKLMTDYIYATSRSAAPPITSNHKVSRHRHTDHHGNHDNQKHQHNAMQQPHHNSEGAQKSHHKLKATPGTTTAREYSTTTTTASSTAHLPEAEQPTLNYEQALQLDVLLSADKNVNVKQSHNTVSDTEMPAIQASQDNSDTFAPTFSSTVTSAATGLSSPSPSAATSTTRKTLRKSTQRLLATPFHQLTYVRNEAGDIDIDSLDNISIYPDLLDNDNVNDDDLHKSGPGGTSRFTMISGYLPTSATATLPESIRIAKIKINRERKRMLRLRNIGGYNA